MKRFNRIFALALVCFLLFCCVDISLVQAAADESSSGGYLSGYQEVDPHPSQTSWWSTLAYLVSLLVVFAFVLVMAYVASRYLGGRFAPTVAGDSGKVLENLPLGPNRSVCIVEIAGRVLMLGVAEQAITLLQEITDLEEIERLRNRQQEELPVAGLDQVFAEQLKSLDKLSRRIPALFKEGRYRK